MSWKTWFLLLSGCCGIAGCALLQADAASGSAVIYRHRFIGPEAVAGLPAKPKAAAILSSTNAIAFRQLVERRFGAWIARSSGKPTASPDHLAAALERLLRSDSGVEIRRSGRDWDGLFAAHLAAGEGDAFVQEVQAAAADLGLSAPGSAAFLSAHREGDWVVATAGTGKAPSASDVKSRLKALTARTADPGNQAGTNTPLLALEADLPALAKLGGWAPMPFKLGRLELAISAQGEFLKTLGTITFPEPIRWSRAPWNVPTNLVHDPLVAFTAIRALGPFAAETGWLADILGKDLGDSQAFHWTVSEVPFQTYFALASARPGAELDRLSATLPPRWNPVLAKADSGALGWNSNRTALEITGLSLVVPQIGATNDASGSWLAGGLVSQIPTRNHSPAPEALLSQFDRRNDLVVYDWEITQERVGYWRVLSQIVPVIGRPSDVEDPVAARPPFIVTERFLQEINDQLGNTITELAVAGPDKLSLSRKSHLGLTGFEIVHLARWLADSPAKLSPIRSAGARPQIAPHHP